MIERMMLLLFPVMWGKISADPKNCNHISRSGYKYPYQETKTILYQVPYQNIASASTKHPTISVQDTNFPLIQEVVPNNLYQNQFHHVPTLNNINQQYLASQDSEIKPRIPAVTFNPNYFISSPSTSHQIFVPNQNTFYPIKTETVHRPVVSPYTYIPIVSSHPKTYPKLLPQSTHPVPNNYQIYSPHVKATPIVYNQVYHPIFPTSGNLVNLPQQTFPTIPRYYTGFKPMAAPIPVPANVQVPHNPKEPREHRGNTDENDENDEREEQKEETQESDEEEDDHGNQEAEPETDVPGYKKDYDFNQNFFKNSKYSFPRFTVDDSRKENDDEEEDDKRSYKVQDHESQEEEESEDDQGESIKNFVFAQPYKMFQNPKQNSFSSSFNKPVAQKLTQSKPKNPKTEVKMVRYTKTLRKPKEYIESNGSESIPVIHKSQHSFQENWYITKSTRVK